MAKLSILITYTTIILCCCACSQKQHVRRITDFTESWKFYLGDDIQASSAIFDDATWRLLDLPHDWSIEGTFSSEHPARPGGGALPGGTGWYRKSFVVPPSDMGKCFYIDFDGIYRNSSVWINGELLGNRPNGYISFRYDLTPHIRFGEQNTIAVRVDNSEQPNSRWYSGSGIYRNVWLTIANPVHVAHWGTYITTPSVSEQSATMVIRTTVANANPLDQQVEIAQILLDAKGLEINRTMQNVLVKAGQETEMEQNMTIQQPHLWELDDPYLYTVVTELSIDEQLADRYTTTSGIRSFDFSAEKGFILNGKVVKINGVCNHHDLGCLGAAAYTRAVERQLEILKAMGCNGIRCSHNPPTPELLDLCDRMGFIVMDEAFDMWRKRKSRYDYADYFPEWHERDLSDLVKRDRNHPSIFMWSIGNEVLEQWTNANADTLTLEEANLLLNNTRDMLSMSADMGVNEMITIKLADIVKQLDPTRPVIAGCNETRPTNHLFRSGALDIIGFNYHHEDFFTVPQDYPGKPFLVTESVSGLMSRGYYQMPSDSMYIWPVRWDRSFTYPVNHCSSYDNCHVPWGTTHENNWIVTKKLDYVAGTFVWTGFDYLGEPTPFGWPARSSYFGIIDLAGFPKDVYYMYQSEWTNQKVLHIFPHWNWQSGQEVDIWAYYNHADEVELFLNGKSLGSKSRTDDELRVWWRVPFEPGVLKAISRKDGKEVLTQEIHTAGKPERIRLTADRVSIASGGKDLSFITVEMLDANGNVVPTADQLIRFTLEGGGMIAGTDNGDPTDHVSLNQPERKLFNGKCLVVVKSGKKTGKLTLSASSEGLQTTELTIKCN